MYIEYCGSSVPNGYLVDATGVTTSVLCDDIPCAKDTANYNDVTGYLNKVVNDMATDEYEVDEVTGVDRDYASGQRVDVLVNF